MRQPTFSICIPNYNYEKYLGITIDSVLAQTYQHFEIIVVDNASSDNSYEVALSYKDPRIKVYRNDFNVGFAPNLQIATSYATGDFINLLSSDDTMNPNALERYAEVIMKNPDISDFMVLASDTFIFDQNGLIKSTKKLDAKTFKQISLKTTSSYNDGLSVVDGHKVAHHMLRGLINLLPFCSTVYSRQLWKKVGGYNAVRSINPDSFFANKILSLNPKVFYFHEPLYNYRVHENVAKVSENIKHPIDQYLNTLEYSDKYLNSIGLSRNNLISEFLSKDCGYNALRYLSYGKYSIALKMFFFAFSTYPGKALLNKKILFLGLLLTLGPFGILLAKLLSRLRNKLKMKVK